MARPKEIGLVANTRHAKLAVYGDPGVGKTRMIGSSPGKVLIIKPPTDHTDSMLPADRARVESWTISDWDEMGKALEYLRHDGAEWDWVWVDSISLLQDHLLDDIWETTIREKPARARWGLDQGEYGLNFFRLAAWTRHVVGPDLFNFGFTAHCAQLLPSEDGQADRKLMPWIQGKNMSPKFCGYMNVVAFLEQAKIGGKDGRRVLRLNSSERFYAKDQFDMTESGRVVDPTMEKVAGLIEASRQKAKAPNTKRAPAARRRRAVKKG